LDRTLRSDLMLTASQFSPFSPQLARGLSSDPDFSAVSPLRQGAEAKVRSWTTFPVGIDPATITEVATIEMTEGTITGLSEPNSVGVSRTEADARHVTVGGTL